MYEPCGERGEDEKELDGGENDVGEWSGAE